MPRSPAGRPVPRSPAGRVVPCGPAGRVVPREERAGHVSRPPAGPLEPSPDLDTAARSSRPTRSALGTRLLVPRRLLDQRNPPTAGRVVPREERAGHVSRPPAGPQEPSPDLDTPPRSSSATRSAEPTHRWSSSAPRGTSRARVETTRRSAGTLTRSDSKTPLAPPPSTLNAHPAAGFSTAPSEAEGRLLTRHASSSLVGYSISGWGVPLVE